jgi:hypothetical protein
MNIPVFKVAKNRVNKSATLERTSKYKCNLEECTEGTQKNG